MIQKLQDGSVEALSVTGLIFDVDSTMTAESTYDTPEVMSEATATQSAQLKPYAYNQLEDPEAYYFISHYQHIFLENCFVLDAIVPTYFVFAGSWLSMSVLFSAYLYLFIPFESRLSL